ncbi:hypothetical protein DdX_15188 [Ditylenchus destructor]|uniref:Uncharacterized protein n=1 Tax=Ditylenchus destructor TaxID=166010 RepID=A0AAD4MPW6_9BILA|nr:hypothetical protein DdX_15188 [Ditylenchus destructor]
MDFSGRATKFILKKAGHFYVVFLSSDIPGEVFTYAKRDSENCALGQMLSSVELDDLFAIKLKTVSIYPLSMTLGLKHASTQ